VRQWLWTKCVEKGDIYLDAYEGWYNVREEAFVTEKQAQASNYKDPDSGKPLIKQNEPSYFFKLSKYKQALLDHIQSNPQFILPLERRTEILSRLKDELQDLSCSRTSFDWGIPVPNSNTAEKHIFYVWFDALANYLTGIDYPNGDLAKFWPANVHIVGKDIIWFHCVIWPSILLSCDIPLPKTIFCHGFVQASDGRKMSKSLGNVIDPLQVLSEYSFETFRYFVLREASFGLDVRYNPTSLVSRHDNELQATLGNLVSRIFGLVETCCQGMVPHQPADPLFCLQEFKSKTEEDFEKFDFHAPLIRIFEYLRKINDDCTKKTPWKAEKPQTEKDCSLRTYLEGLYILAHFLSPFLPETAQKIFKSLGHPCVTLPQLNEWNNLTPGVPVVGCGHLFERIKPNKFVQKAAKGQADQ